MAKRGPRPGTPTYVPPKPFKERILGRIVKDANDCWNWTGPRNAKGYGHTFFGSRVDGTRRNVATHRAAYEAWKGPIPEGMQVDHLCFNTACCNPDHLDVVTSAENMRRRAAQREACQHGHPYNAENTYYKRDGSRQCRVCKREHASRRRAEFGPRPIPERDCAHCGKRFVPGDYATKCCSRACGQHMRRDREHRATAG